MAGRYQHKINHNSEFELDLAPLLAVMVKLVPVLLVSSAFVQLMIIESELPQVVQQAIQKEQQNPNQAKLAVDINKSKGYKLTLTELGKEKINLIGLNKDNQFDLVNLHQQLIEIKKSHPEIFKIEINPDANVAYKDIVRFMDEARKSRSQDINFPIHDEKNGKDTTTEYMFPEIIFTNMMDG